MKIHIVTASAGAGKTYRLSQELLEALRTGDARPERIVATTFTTRAASELVERARGRLLAGGLGRQAHQLLSARIGTVNSVCGGLVADFAFELGLSPELAILDEAAAEVELHRALAGVVDRAIEDELYGFTRLFDQNFDWRFEVRRLIEAARSNHLDAAGIDACRDRSIAELDACLGPCEPDRNGNDAGNALDAALVNALRTALASIDLEVDTTKGTGKYVDCLRKTLRAFEHGWTVRWGDWVKLAKEKPRKKSEPFAEPVQEVAARHIAHPRLRRDLHRLIARMFAVARDGLAAYQAHKRSAGVIDFIDQEALALELLRRDDVRDQLAGQIDLVLIDEFQDTSPLQLEIFLQLARLAKRSVWVGDPKQAIFGFRGTDPKLMDDAIEALTDSVSNDPELVDQAVQAIEKAQAAEPGQGAGGAIDLAGTMETLGTSYRSRPDLVRLTSDVFAGAFAHQGMPPERVRLEPHLTDEPDGLGDYLEHWPLVLGKRQKNQGCRTRATAAAVRRLLDDGDVRVRDRTTGDPRPTQPRDVAILCRTNKDCTALAEQLARVGVDAEVPRSALFSTAEGQLTLAAVRLWIDPRDRLARAHLLRLLEHPDDLDAFVDHALQRDADDKLEPLTSPAIEKLLAARQNAPHLGPTDALDAIFFALDADALCAAWGDTRRRRANLEALRGHAQNCADAARAAGRAITLVGFIEHVATLLDDFGWSKTRADQQAVNGGESAVRLSTWHRAKGLEWPITILHGLEKTVAPKPHGVHVFTDAETFDLKNALAGRWVRYWPNPYNGGNAGGAVRTAYEQHPTFQTLQTKADREALRLLYVGWTRARDRLVLAAEHTKLLAGLLGKLAALDPTADPGDAPPLINDPAASLDLNADTLPPPDRAAPHQQPIHWAGTKDARVAIHPAPVPAAEGNAATDRRAATTPATSGQTLTQAGPRDYPPARQSPSALAAKTDSRTDATHGPATTGQVIDLGHRIPLQGNPNMEHVGHAIHGFLAADRPGLNAARRLAIATGLVHRWALTDNLDPTHILTASDNFQAWLAQTYPGAKQHREWPLNHRLPTGTEVAGTADLLVETQSGIAIVDHKTFPGSREQALSRALQYMPQLDAYQRSLAAAKLSLNTTWIHFPAVALIVELATASGP